MRKHTERGQHDTTVAKIDSTWSPRGPDGEKYLASGVRVSMRLWDDEPVGELPESSRDYETVGYIIAGRAELHLEDQVVLLEPGDSYVVPRRARHHYRILEPLTAVEATSPPAEVHGRDTRTTPPAHVARGPRDRIIHQVEAHGSLPRHVTPAAAISAVMCALTERLTAGEAHDLLEALPRSVRPLLEQCAGHRGHGAVAKIDRAELLDRVAHHLAVTPAHAELISAAVFEVIEAELPPKLVDDVARQLPRDLQALWLSPGASAAKNVRAPITEAAARRMLDEMERYANLPASTSADEAFSVVMCALCDRISGGEAKDVLLGLPETVRPLVEHCVLHRAEPAIVFDRSQLLRRIADHLGVAEDAAEAITRAVFGTARRMLPAKEVNDITSQLPADLVELWLPH